MKQPAVYLMASRRKGTLYTGVTANRVSRAHQRRDGSVTGLTARYGCKLLVWYELHEPMENAILREKQIKSGSRATKLTLIEGLNPNWRDLYREIA
jgi:predicted GIY-YIG superfamily endonuclease